MQIIKYNIEKQNKKYWKRNKNDVIFIKNVGK